MGNEGYESYMGVAGSTPVLPMRTRS